MIRVKCRKALYINKIVVDNGGNIWYNYTYKDNFEQFLKDYNSMLTGADADNTFQRLR